MLHIPTPTSDITVFFVVPLLVFERARVLVWPFSYPKCSERACSIVCVSVFCLKGLMHDE